MLQHELRTAIDLARKAGEVILEHYKTDFVAEYKIGADNYSEPVTAADRDASRVIVEGLTKTFPNDAVLSEEETDDLHLRLKKDRVWIIDPIDGTAGYVKRDGDFAVQIGLAENGEPVLGVVYMPAHAQLNYATKGDGSFCINNDAEPVRMHTSDKRNFHEMSVAVSRHHKSPRMRRIVEHFGFARTVDRGSVGLKISLLVEATCDFYISPGGRTKLWDTCAPQVILTEAGGRFTDLFGNALIYDTADLQNRNGLLATNGVSHDKAVAHLKPLLREFGRAQFSEQRIVNNEQ